MQFLITFIGGEENTEVTNYLLSEIWHSIYKRVHHTNICYFITCQNNAHMDHHITNN